MEMEFTTCAIGARHAGQSVMNATEKPTARALDAMAQSIGASEQEYAVFEKNAFELLGEVSSHSLK